MLRNDFIKPYIKNKLVLDLGFLGENANGRVSKLHQFIRDNSKKVVGVDIQKEEIENLKKKGFDVIYDDVVTLKNTLKTKKKFDVVLAGELIEHLSDPKSFIRRLRKLVAKDGIIILTTPNMCCLRFFLRHTLNGHETIEWKNRNQEIDYGHVIGFSKTLLEKLVLREGFEIIDSKYIIKSEYGGFRGTIEKSFRFFYPKFLPQLGIIIK